LLEVDQRVDARLAPFSPATEKLGSPRPSLVVLPFANIGGDLQQDYFVDGVTESLTTDLSQMSGMLVIGRNTAFSYKSKPVDLKQIGRELNVRYVLEGSAQRSANRMRVNVQLIDAQTGNHLWADRIDNRLRTSLACKTRSSLDSPTRSIRSSSSLKRDAPSAHRVRTQWISIFRE
jgi:TolB-like protein